MADYIVFRDGEPVGFITDRALAEHLFDREIVTDGMYERATYTTKRASKVEHDG